MRIKRPTVGREERQKALPSLLPSTMSLYLSAFLLFSPLLRQGQPVYPITTGGFRHPYPTALTVNASMSRWVEPQELNTHTHTYVRLCFALAVRAMHRQHTHAHSHPETVSSNFSLKESSHSPSPCSKGQFSSVGLQLACSNINYIYHFLMRPLKNIYPCCMSGRSEMSWGTSLLWVWAARQINKHRKHFEAG